jgi:hypothetical protein
MQQTAVSLKSNNAYFEVKPGSVTEPHVAVALTVLVSQFPGIVSRMVRQVSTREYAVRLFVPHEGLGAFAETWVPVRDVPYETQEALYGQCVGNPPVLWAVLIERALQHVNLDGDLSTVLHALTGRRSLEALSNRESMNVLWSAVCSANLRALVISRMNAHPQSRLLGVLGAYTDNDGSRHVVLQQGRETLDMPLARYLAESETTYVLSDC